MVSVKKIIKVLLKNLVVFIAGSIIGIMVFFLYFFKVWLPVQAVRVGLGIIALVPVALVFAVILGIFFGGPLGVVLYLVVKKLRK